MEPVVAVVVTTWDRAAHLDRLLGALADQEGGPPFEVVVIDNGSHDATPEVVRARSGDFALPIRHLHEPVNVGPAAARNRGWRASPAPVIAFTDDDCIPAPTWLAALARAVDDGADVAQGRTEPALAQRHERGPFSLTVERKAEDGFYETCNIAYRREWLERLGGFDEAFVGFYAEDVDLGWRAKKAGATTAFVDDAFVEHEIWPFTWKSRLNDIRRREGMNVLLAKHPELRDLFPSRWFQKPTHPRAVVTGAALVALAAKPRSRRRWLATFATVGAYYRVVAPERINVRRRDWPWVLPLCLASDLADVASLARGSARQGALFL